MGLCRSLCPHIPIPRHRYQCYRILFPVVLVDFVGHHNGSCGLRVLHPVDSGTAVSRVVSGDSDLGDLLLG